MAKQEDILKLLGDLGAAECQCKNVVDTLRTTCEFPVSFGDIKK